MRIIKRETVVAARTSATSGTATVDTIFEIGAMALLEFDELLINIVSSQSLAGTTPTMDIYLQRAIHPTADPAISTHWQDIVAFPQITAGVDELAHLPVYAVPSAATSQMVDVSRAREEGSISGDRANFGHWGDRIRIREKMGGTVTTSCIYSIHMTGLKR